MSKLEPCGLLRATVFWPWRESSAGGDATPRAAVRASGAHWQPCYSLALRVCDAEKKMAISMYFNDLF